MDVKMIYLLPKITCGALPPARRKTKAGRRKGSMALTSDPTPWDTQLFPGMKDGGGPALDSSRQWGVSSSRLSCWGTGHLGCPPDFHPPWLGIS